MQTIIKSKEEVISDISALFNLPVTTEEGKSYEHDGTFYILKAHFERYEVLSKLQSYFVQDTLVVKITGWVLQVESVTFVHTTFKLIPNGKN